MQFGSVNFAIRLRRPASFGRRVRGADCRRACECKRAGFTLLEITIVLLILVITGALAMPAVMNSLRSQRLKSAAETVRIEFSRAHVKAMKTGRIMVFRYELGGRQFSIQPWIAADEATETPPDGTPAGFGEAPMTDSPLEETQTKSLDDGITFAAGEAKFDTRAYQVEDFLQTSASSDSVQWSRPVLFYPDGSTSDAFVIVADDKQDAYRVQLRGLTGTSYVSERQKLDDLLAAAEPGQVNP